MKLLNAATALLAVVGTATSLGNENPKKEEVNVGKYLRDTNKANIARQLSKEASGGLVSWHCPHSDQVDLRLTVKTDWNSDETSIEIKESSTRPSDILSFKYGPMGMCSTHYHSIGLCRDECYELKIKDSGGDGMKDSFLCNLMGMGKYGKYWFVVKDEYGNVLENGGGGGNFGPQKKHHFCL